MSYAVMTSLLESVPAFKETWVECLGDLARYRMAIEESDMRDRALHSIGIIKPRTKTRILVKFSIISRYSRARILCDSFFTILSHWLAFTDSQITSAKDSILLLFNPLLDAAKTANYRHPPLVMAFVSAHGIIFTQGSVNQFVGCVRF
jgi:hypothetical protein